MCDCVCVRVLQENEVKIPKSLKFIELSIKNCDVTV